MDQKEIREENRVTENAPREYVAFISYRHKELDKKIAKKVHTMIERYVVPKELRKQVGGKKLGHVFRDEEELPVSSNLTDSIQTALDHSKFLIVICTPDTPPSVWVEREIAYFLEHHDRANVIGVLVNGTPEESFPSLLTHVYDSDRNGELTMDEVEPLAANLTNVDHKYEAGRIRKEIVRLYAALIGCPFDSLWQRERRQKMRKLVAVMGLAMTVMLAFTASIYRKNLEISARNKQIEEQNDQIQAQNEEIKKQYSEIEQKNASLRLSEADTLIREGELLYEKGDMRGAMDRAARAISTEEGKAAYSADAEWLAYRASGAGNTSNVMRTVNVVEQEDNVTELLLSEDGSRLYSMGSNGYVCCFDVETGDLLWKGDSLSRSYHYYVAKRQRMLLFEEEKVLVCCNEDAVTALSLTDGSVVWSEQFTDGILPDFTCLAPDGKTLAILKSSGFFTNMSYGISLVDVATGTETKRLDFPEEFASSNLQTSGNVCGAFSADGRYLAIMAYGGAGFGGYDRTYLLLADMQEKTVKMLRNQEIGTRLGVPFTIGTLCHGNLEVILIMHYDVDKNSVCMEEVHFDGTVGEYSEVSMAMPDRDVSDPYDSTFVPGDNNGILASCGEVTFLYRKDNGELLRHERYSSENILNFYWMDYDKLIFSCISGDGLQYVTYLQSGYTIADILDKSHVVNLAITKDYAYSDSGFGYSLYDNVTSALVCDERRNRIYIQKPSMDPDIKEADWIAELGKTTVKRMVETFGDDGLLLVEWDDDGNMRYKAFQVSAKEALKDVTISNEDGSAPGWIELKNGYLWPDCVHFTYRDGYVDYYVYDVDKKTKRVLFDGYRTRELKTTALSSGEVLHVALAYEKNASFMDENYVILWRIDDGEIHEIPLENAKVWVAMDRYAADPNLWAAETGYVIHGQYSDESQTTIKGFGTWNVRDGKYAMITDEGAPDRLTAIGRETPVFAVQEADGTVRVYDLTSQSLKKEIPLKTGCAAGQILFCRNDSVLAVWTMEKSLLLYDVASGALLVEENFLKDSSHQGTLPALQAVWDSERDRIFFTLGEVKTSADTASICVDCKSWKKTADFNGLQAYFPKGNQILCATQSMETWAGDGPRFFCYRAYGLDDLMKKTLR